MFVFWNPQKEVKYRRQFPAVKFHHKASNFLFLMNSLSVLNFSKNDEFNQKHRRYQTDGGIRLPEFSEPRSALKLQSACHH